MKCVQLFVLFSLEIGVDLSDPVVKLPNGLIRGQKLQTSRLKEFYSFKKIPYAQAPVGTLRFRNPREPLSWAGILDCTTMDVVCYQMFNNLKNQSENCLFLNVYTPDLPESGNGTFPVMVYIHGGGFTEGMSQQYHPQLFVENGVVLVTFNYRLGPFGFLSTQDETIPGNNGLKDQNLALKWVNKNIQLFSGDPQKITIFGHSAGSASVGYHLLNPKPKNLFWAAICQSGSFLGPWAYQRQPRRQAFLTAGFINNMFLERNDSEELLNVLQNVKPETIRLAAEKFYDLILNGTSDDFAAIEGSNWAPTLEIENEDSFISEKMFKLLKNGNIVKVPLMIGLTTEENLSMDHKNFDQNVKKYDEDYRNLVPVDMIGDEEKLIKVGQMIREMYTGGRNFSENIGDAIRFSSDNDMTRPIMKQAEIYSSYAPTYFYQFSYDGQFPGFKLNYPGTGNVSHGEELFYLFDLTRDITTYPKQEQIVRNRLIKLWTNFAKFRNPTPEPMENVSWPQLKVEENHFPYLDIGEKLAIKNFPKKEIYKKWNQLYETLGHDEFDTY
ncbi:juvenile hormone esterase-like [Tribolium madens]|uniref:juvenile hormone esterase-like n=1 Tax=Tribolium madens TaxID=41895 RepID=UPI001CF7434A|nr:juvenile hormone esterase-like [Tribolium madens]